MKYLHFVLICLLIPTFLFGKRTPRPTLLVYGDGVEAYAAAVQSALSNVPTLWVTSSKAQEAMNMDRAWSIPADHRLNGGIWMKLLMEIADYKSPNDSVASEVKQHISAGQLWTAAQPITQKLPQLTILENTTVKKIALGRRGWQVQLNNGKRYDFRAVVDASMRQELVNSVPEQDRWQSHVATTDSTKSDAKNLQCARITLAVGEHKRKVHTLTAPELLGSVKNNFFSMQSLSTFEPSAENIPLRMHYAQAIGAAAAYVSFFKTTTDQIAIRKLQSELLTSKSRLMPAIDVATENRHFHSWQKIYLTGLFTLDNNHFAPNKKVHYAEIRSVLNQLYSRSQLWFIDHDGEELLWKDAIELVKFLGTRGTEVNRQIADEWSKKFQFEGAYDLERVITRGEFAVILDQFANPYGISITQDGEIRR